LNAQLKKLLQTLNQSNDSADGLEKVAKFQRETLSQTVSEAPEDAFQPALKRSFGRSDSTASGDSPKERIGESISLLILYSPCVYIYA
jgi:hypothetical protein